jgi:hypothetical protein
MPLSIRIIVTVPKEILNADAIRLSILRAQQQKTGPDLKRLFRQTVEGWKNKPNWMQHQESNSSRIAMQVWAGGTYANQYALVNAGSPRHLIPLKPGFLRFQRGYRPATSPRVLSSHAYSRFGPYSFAKQVNHRGFIAREFDAEIAEEYAPQFAEDMQVAIHNGILNP